MARGSTRSAYADAMREAGPFIGLGFQLAGAMAIFAGGGYLADRYLGTLPWLTLLGCALGVMAVFAVMYKLLLQLDQKDKRRRAEGTPPQKGPANGPFQ